MPSPPLSHVYLHEEKTGCKLQERVFSSVTRISTAEAREIWGDQEQINVCTCFLIWSESRKQNVSNWPRYIPYVAALKTSGGLSTAYHLNCVWNEYTDSNEVPEFKKINRNNENCLSININHIPLCISKYFSSHSVHRLIHSELWLCLTTRQPSI